MGFEDYLLVDYNNDTGVIRKLAEQGTRWLQKNASESVR